MRDAERLHARAQMASPELAMRPEGEPHLTFETLLADTLHEMQVDEERAADAPDSAARLCDDAVAALRAAGTTPLSRPFHHAYLTPIGTPTLPSRPTRLDVLY